MKKRLLYTLTLILAWIPVSTGMTLLANDASRKDAPGNVMKVAQAKGHTVFYKMVMTSDKLGPAATAEEGAENSMAPFTVFVPTNKAIGAHKDTDKEKLKDMVKLLVVPGQKFASKEELAKDTVPTVAGTLLKVTGDKVTPEDGGNTVNIVDGPLKASNGVVYVIDEMLSTESGENTQSTNDAPPEAGVQPPLPPEDKVDEQNDLDPGSEPGTTETEVSNKSKKDTVPTDNVDGSPIGVGEDGADTSANTSDATITNNDSPAEAGTQQNIGGLIAQAREQKGITSEPITNAQTTDKKVESEAPTPSSLTQQNTARLEASVRKLTDTIADLTTQLKAMPPMRRMRGARDHDDIDLAQIEEEIDSDSNVIKLPEIG